jgi:acyl-CoA reductase-like NAD-dependent aldehyde dehydrogenase
MKEEIFGPVLPILTWKNFDEVIVKHIGTKGKPLAIYYAGNAWSSNFKRLCDETSSGNVSTNDALMYVLNPELAFGGVGNSGYGSVCGYESFKRFSNLKSIVVRHQTNFWPYTTISPPFTSGKMSLLRILMKLQGIK